MSTQSIIQKDETIVIGAIRRILKDQAVVFAAIAVLGMVAVAVNPNISGQQQQNLETVIALLAGLVVGGYKLSDIAAAFATPPASLLDAIERLISAIASNPPATVVSATQGTGVSPKSVFPTTNPVAAAAAYAAITSPVPPKEGYVPPPTVKSVAAPQGDPEQSANSPKSNTPNAAKPDVG